MAYEDDIQDDVNILQSRLHDMEEERRQTVRILRAHQRFLGAIRAALQRHPELAGIGGPPPGLEDDLVMWLAATGSSEDRWLLQDENTIEWMARLIRQEPHMTWGEVKELLWLRKKAQYEKSHTAPQ